MEEAVVKNEVTVVLQNATHMLHVNYYVQSYKKLKVSYYNDTINH